MPDRVLFASCSSQHYKQVIWPSIISRNASAFVWAGDAVYADDFESSGRWMWPRKKVKIATPQVLRDLYEQQWKDPGYKALLETNISILGTWDDHE